MSDRIMTLHPGGKKGVNIDRSKYDTVRQAIETVLHAQPGATFSELTDAVGQRIGRFFRWLCGLVCDVGQTRSGGAGPVGADRRSQSTASAAGETETTGVRREE